MGKKGVYNFNPETRVLGKVCEKHPELNGLRIKGENKCVACVSARNNVYAKTYSRDKERSNESCRAYYRRNLEYFSEKRRKYQAANFEKEKVARLAWIAANYDKVRAAGRAWGKANPANRNMYAAIRRASKLRAMPLWANTFFIEEAYILAAMRSKETGIKHHIDHVVPINSKLVCGLHCEFNLKVIPGKENLIKQNRYWPDMPD